MLDTFDMVQCKNVVELKLSPPNLILIPTYVCSVAESFGQNLSNALPLDPKADGSGVAGAGMIE